MNVRSANIECTLMVVPDTTIMGPEQHEGFAERDWIHYRQT